ncbi:MMPL family transporter [Saccharibacter sp. 17.LH.SD]|uniref:MMPL family transporter n=1 Tax=Saccharibacter sp. 17.LH.SD TaxID=2689393 RepID=UPI001372042D|nr:MMPL family transporter [Saccharibacter sp. 17.LH.SD]MXV45230.1 MMPL family transporter [Saccharibacter sp. 17.LH.SD]
MLSDMTDRLNAFCVRHALWIVMIFALLCAGAGWLSVNKLGISTETDKLFADSLPWKQQNETIERLFPGEKNTLVAVISAATPEEGRAVAHQLALTLKKDTQHFTSVTEPAADPFYIRNAFLFLDTKDLEPVLDSTISAQPFLSTLAADPSARGLFSTFNLIAIGIKNGQSIPKSFSTALDGLAASLDQASRGNAQPLSWQNLLAGKLSELGGKYQFVVTHPRHDFTSFEPSEAATQAMQAALNQIPIVQNHRAHALITGEAKLSDEEFSTVAQGMLFGLIISLSLVTLWLVLAVRSIRIIIPVLLTLISGLLLTTGFAALCVGTLNLISVAFAILFVGIAVDFAIQYTVRFRSQKDDDGTPLPREEALIRTGKESGNQIFVAALATAAGFMGFIPTSFIGVAQLGLIAGIGMLIAFTCTLSLLPSLLSLFRAKPVAKSSGFACLHSTDMFLQRRRRPVILCFTILGLIGISLIPFLDFDSDPLHTKNPNTEGMKALTLLEENPLTTPYSAQLLLPNEASAKQQAQELSKLPSVHDVLWLESLVPTDQTEKLELIHDAADILLPTLEVAQPEPAPNAQEIRNAAIRTVKSFDQIDAQKLTPALKTIRDALDRLGHASDATIMEANKALVLFLPDELSQLSAALTPSPVTINDIPNSIRAAYLTKDGVYRLIIHPKGRMSETQTLHRFVRDIKTVNPNISGPALEITGSAETITHAFIAAAALAMMAISCILLITLRRLLDTVFVLLPLLLSSLLTVILIICVPEPLNYANIIALPLLLGVGVSFNIYFVMNWRAGVTAPLTSPTARAVLFSALTTGSAFGSLAASAHPGTASMGRLLLLSLGCTLLCSLLFIPALLPPQSRNNNVK